MPKSITYNNRTKVAQTQSQVQPPMPMTENAQQQPNQAQQFFNNAVSTASGYAARIPAVVLAVNRALFAYKIYRIPTEINQYIAMASRVGMTNEARFLSQALLAEPDAVRSVFARAVLTYADARAAGYLANFAGQKNANFNIPELLTKFTTDEVELLKTKFPDMKNIEGAMLENPNQFRDSLRSIVKGNPTIAEGKNILPLDKIAMDQANLGKGNRLLSAIEEINATVENPALAKVTSLIRENASHMPNVIFGVLGTILSTTDLIQHINKMRSRSNHNPSTMTEEEKAQYNEDIYYFVTKCINVIGNVMLTIPPTAPLGGAILAVTFAMDFAPGAAKSLGTSTAQMEMEDLLSLGNPVGQLNFLNKAKNKRYFENEQQMQAIQQQAEQNLSVAADTSDPDVQAVLTFIKARLPLYSNGMEVNKAALMGKAIDDFLGSNEAKTWENPEKWKWLKERNANDMKYKNLTTAIAQMSKQLPTKPITMTNYPQVYNNNQFGSQAYRNTGQIQQNYIPNARYKTT